MNDTGNESSREKPRAAAADSAQFFQRLLQDLSHASAIGFAVIDRQLRYQTVNTALARMNRLPVESHLGNTLRDVLGPAAPTFEPVLRQVFAGGKSVSMEFSATLPARSEPDYWLETYFPIRSCSGAVTWVGALAVEITAQKKLDQYLRQLAGELLHRQTRQNFWPARELHDALEEYHAAVAFNLDLLIRNAEKNTELLAGVQRLDRRIANMRTLVSDVAERFLIHPQRYSQAGYSYGLETKLRH